MPVWRIETDAEQVRLTYLKPGEPPQDCGHGPLVLLREVEGFAIDSAAVWDLVQTDRGLFVRQSNLNARA